MYVIYKDYWNNYFVQDNHFITVREAQYNSYGDLLWNKYSICWTGAMKTIKNKIAVVTSSGEPIWMTSTLVIESSFFHIVIFILFIVIYQFSL